ncbi:MAG TPA: MBL fold metallo-hydrolase [Chitinophagaceae bacterium]|jgi:glyoxylase-like metal-dependent hydrolase (beta-lactamase superfamily II)|nr:MBL fold metallo-hydrolase [Chitinophagaceae bacterium]
MNRRNFIHSSALTLGALTIAQQKLFASFFDDPWKIKPLRNDISIFTERGGTIAFLLSKKGVVVVDAQFPDQSKHLIDAVKKKTEKPFKLLINTHHHGDHTAGNISFKGIVEHVLAHQNSLKNQKNSAVSQKTEDKQLYPDQTFTDTWCQKIGKEKICLYYHGAGHTDGDAIIHFEHANIVHMGDLMFNRRHPFVDRSAGASIKNWIAVLDKATNHFSNETIFIFGHAADGYEVTGTKDDLKAFGEYLGKVLNFVDGEIKAGKTKDEVLKTTSLLFDTQWKGDGLQRPLQAAYEELTIK